LTVKFTKLFFSNVFGVFKILIPGTFSSIPPHVNIPSCIVIVPVVSKSLVEIVISALLSANCSTSIDAFPIVFPLYGNTASITAWPTVVAASVLETPFPTYAVSYADSLAFVAVKLIWSLAEPISFFCSASLALAGADSLPVSAFIVIPAKISKTIIVITSAISVIPLVFCFKLLHFKILLFFR
jgi:hypothetical protein